MPYPILVCAHTNVAVDLIGVKCIQGGLNPLRFGIPARIRPDLKQHSFDERIKGHRWQQRLRFWDEKEEKLQAEISDTRPQMTAAKSGESIYNKDAAEYLKDVELQMARVEQRIGAHRLFFG